MERSPISASPGPAPGAAPPVIEAPALPATGNADHMIERLSPFRVPPRPNRAARRRATRGVLTSLAAALMLATALLSVDMKNKEAIERMLEEVRAGF